MSAPTPLDRVRALCLALPETTERPPGHGSPTSALTVAPKRLAEAARRARG